MTDDDNLNRSEAYAELGPTPALTCSGTPPPNSKPPAEIRRLIGELGLRYRPAAQADLEAHAGSLALLARDLADVPPKYLAKAIHKWTMESKFMPKAAELAALARQFLNDDRPDGGVDWAERGNAHARSIGRHDINWYYDELGNLKIETVRT